MFRNIFISACNHRLRPPDDMIMTKKMHFARAYVGVCLFVLSLCAARKQYRIETFIRRHPVIAAVLREG
jgi:hypothetical protein